jgi:hypothetical protein
VLLCQQQGHLIDICLVSSSLRALILEVLLPLLLLYCKREITYSQHRWDYQQLQPVPKFLLTEARL